jgi:hypothetical protein
MNNEPTVQEIQSRIIHLPNRPPFMLDKDLAEIYETETKRINEAVRRNPKRFPSDFCFRLTKEETDFLRSQNATFKQLQDVKYLPHGFTREGANMLSAVLHTDVAVDRSIQIMRAFSAMERDHAHYHPDSEQISGELFDVSARRFITALEVAKLAGIRDDHEARQTANRITKQTTGFDLLDFIRPGYSPAVAPLHKPKNIGQQKDASEIRFVEIWWEKYGEEPVDSHYLRQMIIDAGIPFNLGNGSQKSQKIKLSRMLAQMKGRQIGSCCVTEAGTYRNSKLWKLKPAGN